MYILEIYLFHCCVFLSSLLCINLNLQKKLTQLELLEVTSKSAPKRNGLGWVSDNPTHPMVIPR